MRHDRVDQKTIVADDVGFRPDPQAASARCPVRLPWGARARGLHRTPLLGKA